MEACLVWILSQVGGGGGQGTTCSTPAAEGLACRCTPSLLASSNGKLGLEN